MKSNNLSCRRNLKIAFRKNELEPKTIPKKVDDVNEVLIFNEVQSDLTIKFLHVLSFIGTDAMEKTDLSCHFKLNHSSGLIHFSYWREQVEKGWTALIKFQHPILMSGKVCPYNIFRVGKKSETHSCLM